MLAQIFRVGYNQFIVIDNYKNVETFNIHKFKVVVNVLRLWLQKSQILDFKSSKEDINSIFFCLTLVSEGLPKWLVGEFYY